MPQCSPEKRKLGRYVSVNAPGSHAPVRLKRSTRHLKWIFKIMSQKRDQRNGFARAKFGPCDKDCFSAVSPEGVGSCGIAAVYRLQGLLLRSRSCSPGIGYRSCQRVNRP